MKNYVVKLFVRQTLASSRTYGGPSSIAPLRASTFLSCESKQGKQIIAEFSQHELKPSSTTAATRREPRDSEAGDAPAPSARTARRRRGPHRRWRVVRRGCRPGGRIRAAGAHRRRRPRARGGRRGAPRSRPRSPARGGGRPMVPRDLSAT